MRLKSDGCGKEANQVRTYEGLVTVGAGRVRWEIQEKSLY